MRMRPLPTAKLQALGVMLLCCGCGGAKTSATVQERRMIVPGKCVGEVCIGRVVERDNGRPIGDLPARGVRYVADAGGRVSEIHVSSAHCRTEGGVEVGSGIADVHAEFGDRRAEVLDIVKPRMHIGTLQVLRYPGIAFALDEDRVKLIVVGGPLAER